MTQRLFHPLRLNGMKVAVIGAGRTGIAAANFIAGQGGIVLLSDKNKKSLSGKPILSGISREYGTHSPRILDADLVIKSPGVPFTIPVLEKARKLRIPIWDELDLASYFLDQKKIIAITGTNGKTTTTSLVSAICRHAGLKTVTAGNIGIPISSILLKSRKADVLVFEVSSYQLENQHAFRPHIAAVLNITPDHLSRHATMSIYRKAKEKIAVNQTRNDFCILNYENLSCRKIGETCKSKIVYFSSTRTLKQGVFFSAPGWQCRFGAHRFTLNPRWQLPGMHNIENACAAIAMTAAFGLSSRVIEQGLSAFKGVAHRLEFMAHLHGVAYINDSKSTNVDSTAVALKSFNHRLWLILGGRDKGSPYKPLLPLMRDTVIAVLLIGEAAPTIRKELEGHVPLIDCHTLKKAVRYCAKNAKKGEYVLLSPACASFDQYSNYEERGEDFRSLVQKLKG